MRCTFVLLALLLALPARAQMVQSWPPAFSDAHSALAAGTARTHVMLGVPRDVMHVRRVLAP